MDLARFLNFWLEKINVVNEPMYNSNISTKGEIKRPSLFQMNETGDSLGGGAGAFLKRLHSPKKYKILSTYTSTMEEGTTRLIKRMKVF